MEQNTDEWKKWRHSKMGASDANALMGKSEFMSRAELLLHKTTPFENLPPQKSNPIADMGHVVEELERPRFEFFLDKKFMPALFVHPEVDWWSTSFDGLSMDETESWESKLVGKAVFDEAVETNFCPEKFFPQIQHQFLVNPKLKLTTLALVCFEKKFFDKINPDTFKRHTIDLFRDDVYINEKLLPELQKFRDDWLKNTDYSQFEKMAERSALLKNEIELLKVQKEVIDDEIKKALLPIGQIATNRWSMSYLQQTTTSYDYDKMIEEFKIDISKFVKKVSVFHKLNVKEKKK